MKLKWVGMAVALLLAAPGGAAGQAAVSPAAATAGTGLKPAVPYSAYDGWRAIQGTALSRDGAWLVYALVPEDGDGELVARNLKTGVEHRVPRGEKPVISADGRYVAFAIVPTRQERDAAARKQAAKPAAGAGGATNNDAPKNGLGILTLATGAVTRVERVESFQLAADGGAYLAYRLGAPAKQPARAAADTAPASAPAAGSAKKGTMGTDLVIRRLADGATATVAGVTAYAWTPDGAQLAYAVHAPDPARDGAYIWTAAGGLAAPARTLLSGAGDYQQLAWDAAGRQLAFVSDHDDAQAKRPRYALYRAGAAGAAAAIATAALPAPMQVSPWGKLEFSRDGQRLFFGIAPPAPVDPPAADRIKVDLWSWTDAELQPTQEVRAKQEAEASYPAVADLAAGQVVALASPAIPELLLSADAAAGVLASDVPYKLAESWQGDNHDYYAVDLATARRRKLLTDQHFPATLSPGGRYLLSFGADSNWHATRLSDGRSANLTAALGVKFQNEQWDQPSPATAYGVAGWTDGDGAVLLYDRYDIWSVAPDGTGARNLTAGLGRRQHLVFRYQKLDVKAKTIPSSGPLLLASTNDDTKASGFYQLASLAAGAPPRRLVMRDVLFAHPIKAQDAATVVFAESRFDQFPNLWASDTSFAAPRQVSDANPQQAQYRWGSSELIHYVNRDGKRLSAILIKPDGFDPHKKYPLMVYIYERLTDTLHHYVPPAPGHSINLTRYVSQGYLVLEPDIVYDTGYPGDSALKCVLPAIETVEAQGYVDPARIGIQGHSWGGYEVAYMITRTDIFRAVEAGAVVADMISAYGGIRWGTGISREEQYEHTQSRIGGPPWQDALQYIENSPLFWVDRVHTPYLTIHNDADDAVPWYQGIEFFTALRREHKPAWMFVFNGEKHHLTQRRNQKYYTVRLDEYFDYWLNHGPEPGWMKTGVPYLRRGEDDVEPLFQPKAAPSAQPRPAEKGEGPTRSAHP